MRRSELGFLICGKRKSLVNLNYLQVKGSDPSFQLSSITPQIFLTELDPNSGRMSSVTSEGSFQSFHNLILLCLTKQVLSENVPCPVSSKPGLIPSSLSASSLRLSQDYHLPPQTRLLSSQQVETRCCLNLLLVLAYSVSPGGCLQVILRIEITVNKNNGICCRQVHANST